MENDYAELVKALKCNNHVLDCEFCDRECCYPGGTVKGKCIIIQAADAIEELALTAQSYKRSMEAWADEVKKPKWISVKETPPFQVGDEGYTGYLVYANGYIEIADYTVDKFVGVPEFHVCGEYEPNVTHWMPLPGPPKEETE